LHDAGGKIQHSGTQGKGSNGSGPEHTILTEFARMKKIFQGRIEKGLLVLDDQKGYDLLRWSLNGKEVTATLAKKTKPRSNNQNAYYWGVVIQLISDHTGYSPDEAHDAMIMKFLQEHKANLDSIKSTTDLSTVEFEDYMSTIRMFASINLDCYIPEPNECTGY
jgi:hypothetical protein